MEEKTISFTSEFKGRIFDLERHQVRMPDGSESIRDIIRHPGAVGVVAQHANGKFVFVKQYRKAIEHITTEVVAGTLDPGEDPMECAKRELTEETGYTAIDIEYLGRIHPSPGYIEEKIELYFATVDEQGETNPDEDENVEAFLLTAEEAVEMILNGQITDSKTVAAWLFYEKRIAARNA